MRKEEKLKIIKYPRDCKVKYLGQKLDPFNHFLRHFPVGKEKYYFLLKLEQYFLHYWIFIIFFHIEF
jgi:hypothetical protein